jgi:hypothetical protein
MREIFQSGLFWKIFYARTKPRAGAQLALNPFCAREQDNFGD